MSFNRWQPKRPRIHPDTGQLMLYATMPNLKRTKIYHVCTPQSMIAQCRLYRAVRQNKIEKQVAIADLYDHCFIDIPHTISKVQMGYIVVGTLLYEPRLLVNNKLVGKATMTYTFRTEHDFQYGLEWMICTWLWKFLNDNAPQDEQISTPEQMLEELDFLGNSDDTEYLDVYESRFFDFHMEEPNWHKICDGLEEEIPEVPVEKERAFVRPTPRKLISMREEANSASAQTDWRETLRAQKQTRPSPDE